MSMDNQNSQDYMQLIIQNLDVDIIYPNHNQFYDIDDSLNMLC